MNHWHFVYIVLSIQRACRESAKCMPSALYWSTAHSRKDKVLSPCAVTSRVNVVLVIPPGNVRKNVFTTHHGPMAWPRADQTNNSITLKNNINSKKSAVMWLKYCQYGVKPYTNNQSIHRSINQSYSNHMLKKKQD